MKRGKEEVSDVSEVMQETSREGIRASAVAEVLGCGTIVLCDVRNRLIALLFWRKHLFSYLLSLPTGGIFFKVQNS